MQISKTLRWMSVITLLAATVVSGQTANETPAQFEARTRWWREAKFGMFIHWGIYAVPADSTDLEGKKRIGEWYLSNKHMQVQDYEKFAAEFNPVKFDAAEWVKTAKEAGMKYIVITSKHHDGFCMFDTKLTDYCVTKATPWKHDPMKDLAEECRQQGIKLCFYHSIMDWHHPDYLPRRSWHTPRGRRRPQSLHRVYGGRVARIVDPIWSCWHLVVGWRLGAQRRGIALS